MVLYSIICFLFRWPYRLLFRVKVEGFEHVPKEGGAILSSTHIHILDPVTLAFCGKRHLRFMAKEELFRFRPFGALLRSLGAFPVRRGRSDKGAVETSANVLKAGHLLGIFPEGTRSKDGKPGEFKAGVVLIARMAQVPIVPVAIIAKHGYLPFGGITIRFGEPIAIETLETAEGDSKMLRHAIGVLREKTVSLFPREEVIS